MDFSKPLTSNNKQRNKSMPKQQHQKGTTSAQLFFVVSGVEGGYFLNWIFEIHLLQFRHKQVHLTTYDSLSRNRPLSGTRSFWRVKDGEGAQRWDGQQ